jgi:hypothetical protein
VKDLAGDLGIREEELIGVARALGWPTIPESLEWWRNEYSGISVGEAVDVTELEHEGSKLLQQTKSKMINSGIKSGKRVYAVKIHNGKGAFAKWAENESGRIETDAGESYEVNVSPNLVAAAWLCSFGAGDTRNIAFEEIASSAHNSLEGVPVMTAHVIRERLGLGERDTYLLFVRSPEEITRDLAELRHRVDEIMQKGKGAERRFAELPGIGRKEAIRRQSHPFIADEMVEIYGDR